MLEAFVKYFKKLSPDIVTGYFSDSFDLPYLKSRAEVSLERTFAMKNSKITWTGIPVIAANSITLVLCVYLIYLKIQYR